MRLEKIVKVTKVFNLLGIRNDKSVNEVQIMDFIYVKFINVLKSP